MFRFVTPEVRQVYLDDEKSDWLKLKVELSVGERRDMDAAGLGGIRAGGDEPRKPGTRRGTDIDVNWARFSLARTIAYLHDWNATDDQGNKIAPTEENIRALDEETYLKIENVITRHIEDMEEEKKVRSAKPSSVAMSPS